MSRNDVLKKCLRKEVKDIYVTGYSELRNNFNFFSTMNWWYYIAFEDFYLCVESIETNGMIGFYTQSEIKCNFEIENEDVFTIMSIKKNAYSKISSFELFYGKNNTNIYAMSILFDDEEYVLFDSLSLDGIEVRDRNAKDVFLDKNRFRLEIIG